MLWQNGADTDDKNGTAEDGADKSRLSEDELEPYAVLPVLSNGTGPGPGNPSGADG